MSYFSLLAIILSRILCQIITINNIVFYDEVSLHISNIPNDSHVKVSSYNLICFYVVMSMCFSFASYDKSYFFKKLMAILGKY